MSIATVPPMQTTRAPDPYSCLHEANREPVCGSGDCFRGPDCILLAVDHSYSPDPPLILSKSIFLISVQPAIDVSGLLSPKGDNCQRT